MTVTGDRRMSEADRAGLAARSPEGHAAKSMHIRGREEEWIQIQAYRSSFPIQRSDNLCCQG